jgi:hypothetical protein
MSSFTSSLYQRYALDCEYNRVTDELVSMALVPIDWPSKDIPESMTFYETVFDVQRLSLWAMGGDNINNADVLAHMQWMEDNVYPVLGKQGVTLQDLQERLEAFLLRNSVKAIYVDWPEDIAWFCRTMITGPGKRILVPPGELQFHYVPGLESRSEIPHNALADAKGLVELLHERWAAERLARSGNSTGRLA